MVDGCENFDSAGTLPKTPDNPSLPPDNTHPISTLWANLTAAQVEELNSTEACYKDIEELFGVRPKNHASENHITSERSF